MEKEGKDAALTSDEKKLLITVSCIAGGLGRFWESLHIISSGFSDMIPEK